MSVAEAVGKRTPPRINGVSCDGNKLMLELLPTLSLPLCLFPITLDPQLPGQLFPSYG